ncbi:endonuclease/exonuclease/phosphatase [Roseiconus nitratireducens]|uniref:Endonuclease/exonuclease/phosphatase n=1 Tax=Roseiconus nitratireducens TaxID=2605748 RepID=A0A5M6D333_9BACT|nr:endonuclease/exonuclease/phosphatase family protein [Roseiconus nitratireducens]KAA5541743.1 endonuclease/exonuclease/phosphatase [Roseiconus nitratireducens]
MARRKSRLKAYILALLTGVSGGGLGGYLNPDWPVIGPIVKSIQTQLGSAATDTAAAQPGDIQRTSRPTAGPQRTPGGGVQLASARRPPGSILIASFNIQVFGESKLSKPGVVDVLAQTVRQFDLVAIQEVRAQADDILPRFLSAINADGSQYSFLIGPRLGRTVSTEQYAFIYDTTRIEYDPSSVGTMMDPSDLLHREPFVTRFRARTNPPQAGFTFWLVNIHTDPDEVSEEVDSLAEVFQVMQTARTDEDDVILLGDLNADQTQLGRLGQVPGITWTVRDTMTNTRKTKAYDNLLFSAYATREYTGRWGVFDLEQAFGISRDDALKVSDHLPVWAEFRSQEVGSQPQLADRPNAATR